MTLFSVALMARGHALSRIEKDQNHVDLHWRCIASSSAGSGALLLADAERAARRRQCSHVVLDLCSHPAGLCEPGDASMGIVHVRQNGSRARPTEPENRYVRPGAMCQSPCRVSVSLQPGRYFQVSQSAEQCPRDAQRDGRADPERLAKA